MTLDRSPRRRRGERRYPSGRRVSELRAELSIGLATDVRTFAAEHGRTIRDVVSEALTAYLDRADEAEAR